MYVASLSVVGCHHWLTPCSIRLKHYSLFIKPYPSVGALHFLYPCYWRSFSGFLQWVWRSLPQWSSSLLRSWLSSLGAERLDLLSKQHCSSCQQLLIIHPPAWTISSTLWSYTPWKLVASPCMFISEQFDSSLAWPAATQHRDLGFVVLRLSPVSRHILCVDIRVPQWLLMRHNLIFLGMHFAIAKRTLLKFKYWQVGLTLIIVYANSLLATYASFTSIIAVVDPTRF